MTTKKTTKITGVPTEAKRARARAAAKGPKAGSARANQSAKLSAADARQIADEAKARRHPDKIGTVQASIGGEHIVVTAGDKVLSIPTTKMAGELQKIAIVGGSYKAVEAWLAAHKPRAKLAQGVDGRTAPNATLAAAQAAKGKAKDPLPMGKGTATPKAATRAARAATPKAAHAGRAARQYVSTGKADNSKAGSYRTYMISTIRAYGDTESAKAAHAASGQFAKERLNFRWAETNGYIAFK